MIIRFLKYCPSCGYKFGSIGAVVPLTLDDGSVRMQFPICKKCLMKIRRGNSKRIIFAIEETLRLQNSESVVASLCRSVKEKGLANE